MITIPRDEFTNDKLPAKWVHIRTGETEITIYEPGDEVPQPAPPAPDPDEPQP